MYRAILNSIFVLSIALSINAHSQSTMPRAVQQYQSAWKERDAKTRLTIIKSFWTENSTYNDPSDHIKGITALNEVIGKLWRSYPEMTLEGSEVNSQGNFHTWQWKIFANDSLLVSGEDFAEINSKGEMIRLVGFWDNTTSATNLAVVRTYYESLFKTQDFETIRKILATDAVYNQAIGLPYGGTFTGFAELMTMFQKASTYFDLTIEKEPQYLLNDTDHSVVVMLFTISVTSKKSGEKISMPIAEQFQVENKKIISIRPFYFDTKTFSEFLLK